MIRFAWLWLADVLFWWWGFWRWRPRVYAHNTDLKRAAEYARRYRAWLAYTLKNAPFKRRDHHDLLTGHRAALETGLVVRRPEPRPGPHLVKRTRGRSGPRIGKPAVYEHRIEPKDATQRVRITRVGETEWDGEVANVYAVNTRAARRHGGWVKERKAI